MLNDVLFCSMLVFALILAVMIAVIGFNHGTIIAFVFTECIVYVLGNSCGLLYLGIRLSKTDTAYRHAHHKEQK